MAPETIMDKSLSRKAITERTRRLSRGQGDGLDAFGRTEVDLAYSMNATSASAPVGQDEYCASIATVDVVVTLKTTTYIAAELAPDTCVYGVVTQREREHVNVIRRHQTEIEGKLRQAIFAAVRKPVIAPTSEQGIAALQGNLWTVVSDTMATMVGAMQQDQAKLGTPEAYGRAQTQCGNAAH